MTQTYQTKAFENGSYLSVVHFACQASSLAPLWAKTTADAVEVENDSEHSIAGCM